MRLDTTHTTNSLHAFSRYRFHFNGKEEDSEAQTQDYGFRIYNPRLGKFLSVDPLTKLYPELTPFQFASNNPIWMIDYDGLEGKPYTDQWNELTSSEKQILLNTPAKNIFQLAKNKELATAMTEELFGSDENATFHNDEADAFRHAFFNALNTQSFGIELANKLGKAHEAIDDPTKREKLKNEIKMDLHNNAVGQKIGAQNPTAGPYSLAALIQKERINGNLVVLSNPDDNQSQLIPSNAISKPLVLLDQDVIIPFVQRASGNPSTDNTNVVIPPAQIPEIVN